MNIYASVVIIQYNMTKIAAVQLHNKHFYFENFGYRCADFHV